MFEVSEEAAREMFIPFQLSQHGCLTADPGSDAATWEDRALSALLC